MHGLSGGGTGLLVLVGVRGTLCDAYIVCKESHYSGVLDNPPRPLGFLTC